MSIGFHAASGSEIAMLNHDNNNKSPFWSLTPKTGGAAGFSRVGFFGADGHGDSVLITTYNKSAYVVDSDGDLPGWAGGASGVLVPMQYTGTNTLGVSGINSGKGWAWNASTQGTVPCESGTFLIRFTEPTAQAVQTLNATFRSVALNSSDGMPDYTAGAASTDIIIYAMECNRHGYYSHGTMTHMDGDGDSGSGGDTAWTRIDSGGSSNSLALWNHAWTAAIHDFSVVMSVSPQKTGSVTTWGIYFRVDYV